MTIDEEMKIPYVSKDLCRYLRETYSLPNALEEARRKVDNADMCLGVMMGLNMLMERLEAITVQQEENDGLH